MNNTPDPLFLIACSNVVKTSPLFVLLVPKHWTGEDGKTYYDPTGDFNIQAKGLSNGSVDVDDSVLVMFLRNVANRIEAGRSEDEDEL